MKRRLSRGPDWPTPTVRERRHRGVRRCGRTRMPPPRPCSGRTAAAGRSGPSPRPRTTPSPGPPPYRWRDESAGRRVAGTAPHTRQRPWRTWRLRAHGRPPRRRPRAGTPPSLLRPVPCEPLDPRLEVQLSSFVDRRHDADAGLHRGSLERGPLARRRYPCPRPPDTARLPAPGARYPARARQAGQQEPQRCGWRRCRRPSPSACQASSGCAPRPWSPAPNHHPLRRSRRRRPPRWHRPTRRRWWPTRIPVASTERDAHSRGRRR